MTERIHPGRRSRNQIARHSLVEARDHGLARRHLLKLMHLAERHRCQCGEDVPHRHVCAYPDVVRALDSS